MQAEGPRVPQTCPATGNTCRDCRRDHCIIATLVELKRKETSNAS